MHGNRFDEFAMKFGTIPRYLPWEFADHEPPLLKKQKQKLGGVVDASGIDEGDL